MKLKKINKIILFGGARLLADFSKYVKDDTNLDLVVFSSKRHLDEKINDFIILKEFLEKNGIKYYNSENINNDDNLKNEITETSLGIAIGAAWVFEKKIIELFGEGNLLDFMGIDLPRYRGGAHYTWQILHQNKKACANLQIIKGGEETFHKGELIKRKEYELPLNLIKPTDYFEFIVKKEIEFLKEFLKEIEQEVDFNLNNLNETNSSYYPFLYTKINGLIDWNWKGKDIFLFINAFDEPYAGASSFINNERVFLKNCELLDEEEKYHPFSSGIIIRKNENGIFVASVGNLLFIRKIFDEEGNDLLDKINLGDRIYTPQFELDKSRGFKANYTPGGLENE